MTLILPDCERRGFSRRRWLQAGLPGMSAISSIALLAGMSRADSGTALTSFGRAKRCVMLFLTGGMPQHDTFDPKPLAPANVRGELSAIDTSVPGMQVSELFPQFASRANHVTLLRSVTHDDTVHTSAGYAMLTGWRHPQANARTAADIKPQPTDRPHVGSIISLLQPDQGVPPFVSLPEIIKDAAVNEFPGLNGGLMGDRYSPLLVEGSVQSGRFNPPPLSLTQDVSNTRLAGRKNLLAGLDRRLAFNSDSARISTYESQRERAFELLTSNSVQQSFDADLESAETRRRYGSHLFGQSCLMARRLLQAGVSLVTVYWPYEGPEDSPVWDTHGNNFAHLRNRLAPPTDAAMSALLDDLADFGMLDETLFIAMGEFGRSPKINAQAGRDHWPQAATVVLAGAGVRAGAVYGSTDRLGGYPQDRPVSPSDLTATMLHLLGVEPDLEIHDRTGRPYSANDGSPILDLFG